jgi:hypothetical protein
MADEVQTSSMTRAVGAKSTATIFVTTLVRPLATNNVSQLAKAEAAVAAEEMIEKGGRRLAVNMGREPGRVWANYWHG